MKLQHLILNLFRRNALHYDGVRPIQIYILRLVYALMFFFVGTFSWTTIVKHQGDWEPVEAIAFCVWAAYSTLSFLGILKPLKLLPIMVFMVFYKSIWLFAVAYPLWISDSLVGSPAEQMTKDFLWIVLPIAGVPWGYFFRGYFRSKKTEPIASV